MDVLAEFPQTGPPRINYLYRGRAGTIVTFERYNAKTFSCSFLTRKFTFLTETYHVPY